MAKLKVNDIKPTGAELFNDSESFMNDLSSDELEQAMGGFVVFPTLTGPFSPLCPPTNITTNITTLTTRTTTTLTTTTITPTTL